MQPTSQVRFRKWANPPIQITLYSLNTSELNMFVAAPHRSNERTWQQAQPNVDVKNCKPNHVLLTTFCNPAYHAICRLLI